MTLVPVTIVSPDYHTLWDNINTMNRPTLAATTFVTTVNRLTESQKLPISGINFLKNYTIYVPDDGTSSDILVLEFVLIIVLM